MKKLLSKGVPIVFPLIFIITIVILLVVPSSGIVYSDALFGAESGTLAREPQVTPADLGDGALKGLQYADPAEQLDLIEPPVADNFGDAQLEHPINIPVGRAGLEPSLALTYDSGAGASWVGTGWDLGVGEVVVDTRFGVPRFLAGAESESYILDGDVLSPTAVVSNFESPRVANRSDFTRRIEDEFERIIRHGDSPTNYFWEVT
ncbi:MAG: SpvB/TcaC N-terminal domain-containing protein, partial [Anaerolineae bacterium]